MTKKKTVNVKNLVDQVLRFTSDDNNMISKEDFIEYMKEAFTIILKPSRSMLKKPIPNKEVSDELYYKGDIEVVIDEEKNIFTIQEFKYVVANGGNRVDYSEEALLKLAKEEMEKRKNLGEIEMSIDETVSNLPQYSYLVLDNEIELNEAKKYKAKAIIGQRIKTADIYVSDFLRTRITRFKNELKKLVDKRINANSTSYFKQTIDAKIIDATVKNMGFSTNKSNGEGILVDRFFLFLDVEKNKTAKLYDKDMLSADKDKFIRRVNLAQEKDSKEFDSFITVYNEEEEKYIVYGLLKTYPKKISVLVNKVEDPSETEVDTEATATKKKKPKKEVIIHVTRKSNEAIKEIITRNIPEIENGTIIIKDIARNEGGVNENKKAYTARIKVGVFSTNSSTDAKSVCIGTDGCNVMNIKKELGDERIDIFKWSEDINELVKEALQPAKVIDVQDVNFSEKTVTAIVKDDDYKQAIGTSGQNVQLANMITKWRIKVEKETDAINRGLELKTR